MTFHMPSGDFVVLFGDGDNVPAQVSVPRPVTASTEWSINTPGTVNVEGDTSYCRTRNGSENNWVIYLAGGGMSVDARTAEKPGTFYTTGTAWNGIWDSAFFSADEVNPFRDWSYLLIPCDTADCYIGAGEFTSVRGTVLHHNGYTNFTDYLEAFAFARPTPDKILLAGSSAGGFGAAMLAAEVCERFPEAEITVLVDCACLSADWRSIATDVWHAPETIVARMETDDCVTDALVALKETYGSRVKILYLAVESDAMLTQYQEYFDTGDFAISSEARNHYNETLKAAVRRLREEVPGAGIWICRQTPIASLSGGGVHMLVPRLESTAANGLTALEWVGLSVLNSVPPIAFDLSDFLGE
jgi:pimeloyl-ACP methyl ester carboxylesterase